MVYSLEELFIALALSLFAIFGAIVKWINIKRGAPTVRSFFSEVLSAWFSGALIYFVYASEVSWLPDFDLAIAFIAAGLVGNQGTNGLCFLFNILNMIINRAAGETSAGSAGYGEADEDHIPRPPGEQE